MASPKIYPNGLNLAGTVFADGPATLQLGGGVYFSGPVQWVSSTTGNNANAGVLPEFPVASIAQAVTNFAAATDGVMIIGKNHAESLVGSQALNLAGLSIFGCGIGSSRPRFTCTGAVDMFAVSGAGTWIEGLYFPASTAVPTDRIGLAAADCTVKDCYFECGAVDFNRALRVHTGANHATVDGCSFVTTADIPATGLEVSAAVTSPTVLDCTFDGGSYGWSSYALLISAAATRIRIINPVMTNRSDIGVSVTATSYQLFGTQVGGTGNVRLDA
jgi:hypothetical protein